MGNAVPGTGRRYIFSLSNGMHDVLTNVADVTQDHAGMRAILRTIAYIGLPRHGAPPCLSGEQSESVSLKTPCGSGRLPRWDVIPAHRDDSSVSVLTAGISSHTWTPPVCQAILRQRQSRYKVAAIHPAFACGGAPLALMESAGRLLYQPIALVRIGMSGFCRPRSDLLCHHVVDRLCNSGEVLQFDYLDAVSIRQPPSPRHNRPNRCARV